MIFILHYLLFNTGLPAIIILLALFLQTHSDASLSEIGALLMALPFVSILIKPLFCALADRQQAHRRYLIIALGLMALGYGSLTIAPFFEHFTQTHGRLVWYLDIVGIVIGFSAFGVIWSLGDALAVNHAQMNGVTWGAYRVWGVVSWGAGGILIGQINELSWLPKYVPAMFLLLISLLAEMLLLALWPNEHFIMGGSFQQAESQHQHELSHVDSRRADSIRSADTWASRSGSLRQAGSVRASPRMIGAVASAFVEDLSGTLRSSLRLGGREAFKQRAPLDQLLDEYQAKARAAEAAVQLTPGFFGSLRKRLAQTLDSNPLPVGSDCESQMRSMHSSDTVGFNNAAINSVAANCDPKGSKYHREARTPTPTQEAGHRRTSTLRRTQMALSRMNSLSAASGHVIADQITFEPSGSQNCSMQSALGAASTPANNSQENNNNNNNNNNISLNSTSKRPLQRQPVMYMSSLASQTSVSNALAARASIGQPRDGSPSNGAGQLSLVSEKSAQLNLSELHLGTTMISDEKSLDQSGSGKEIAFQSADELQLVLLKLIVRHDKSIWKYLIMFTLFGALLTCHLSYFFLHLEQMCRTKGVDFALVSGAMLAAHSVSEVFSFTVVVPRLVPLVGRAGALLACALFYALRFAYYGFYLELASPFSGVPFELAHGIVYGIVYSLITDIACECVNQVDLYFPDLIERRLVAPNLQPAHLKLQLRATMQGLFSGAFDGLGNGIGALFGGLFLDAHPFAHLWRLCTYVCLATLLLYPLAEWNSFFPKSSQLDTPETKTKGKRETPINCDDGTRSASDGQKS